MYFITNKCHIYAFLGPPGACWVSRVLDPLVFAGCLFVRSISCSYKSFNDMWLYKSNTEKNHTKTRNFPIFLQVFLKVRVKENGC